MSFPIGSSGPLCHICQISAFHHVYLPSRIVINCDQSYRQTSIYFVSEICPPAYLCLKTQRAVSGNELELKGCGSFYSFWADLYYPFLPLLRWTIWSALRTSRGHTHHFSNSVAHILFTDLALILLLVSRLASYSNVIMTDTGGTTTSFQYLQSSLVCLDCSIPHLFCNIIHLD